MDPTHNPQSPPNPRDQLIQRLMDDVRISLAAGRSVNEQALMAAHPDLMPELGEAFKRLWDGQRPNDGSAHSETIARPIPPQAPSAPLDATIARPGATPPPEPPPESPPELSNPSQWPTASSPSKQETSSSSGFRIIGGGPDSNRQVPQIPGYSVQRELSRGGQAVVYIAIQLSTGRKVALKVMRDGPFADERSMTRFQREVQILAALDHPNIVSIMDTGRTADGSHYIAMPYISGTTLDDHMKRRQQKDPDPSKLLRLFYKICIAVNEAHLRGIVHRDLKPSNIRVDERGEPHVLDFGLARTALDRFIRGSDQPVSVTGEFLGSLPWSSPEQAEGDPEKIDMRTDVYSLGVILYQMLTAGRFPYEVVGNIRDVLNNILTTEPKPPSQILASNKAQKVTADRGLPAHPLPSINEAIERIVLKALSKRKETRYQNAGELGKDVARYLLGKPTAAGSPGKTSEPVKPSAAIESVDKSDEMKSFWAKRHWKPLVAGIGMVVLLTASTIVWSYWPKHEKQNADAEQIANNLNAEAPANQTQAVAVNSGSVSPPVSAPSDIPAGNVDGSWTSLFNGNDLSKLEATRIWQVRDKTIVSVPIGARGPGSVGTLRSLREFQNFDLKITTKLIQNNVVTVSLDATNTAVKGFSVTMGGYGQGIVLRMDKTGDIRVNGELRAPADRSNIQQDQWYTLELIYQGTQIKTLINDRQVSVYSDPSLAGMKGKIQISKAAFPADVLFREILIRDLSASSAPQAPSGVAPTAGVLQPSQPNSVVMPPTPLSSTISPSTTLASPANGGPTPIAASPAANAPLHVDLLKLFDPAKDTVAGKWTMNANGLVCESSRLARLEFPYTPPEEYDYQIVFVWLNGTEGINQICHAGGHQFDYCLAGWGNKITGFDTVDNLRSDRNRTTVTSPKWFTNGQKYTSVVKVRKTGAEAFLDGRLTTSIKSNFSDMGLQPELVLHNAHAIGISVPMGVARIESAEIIEVTGTGQLLRAVKPQPATRAAMVPLPTKAGDMWTNASGMKLAYIPAGKFTMGSPTTEAGRNANEIPHAVSFAKPILMGTTTVTVGQFKAFVAATAYKTDAEKKGEAIVWTGTAADNAGEDSPKVKVKGASWKSPGFAQSDNDPVVEISWTDANAYCAWLSTKENRRYRLPTEAEWEYACRAGTTTRYAFGDTLSTPENRAWVRSNSGSHTHPVGQLKANAWGLFDMSGNVYQWCADFFATYAIADAADPTGPATGTEYVTRGGSWDVGPTRAAHRGHSIPDHVSNDNGFRIVLEF